MKIYRKNFDVEYKHDNSPLTLADKKANKVIEIGLKGLSVNYPILSEEGKDVPYEKRKHWEYFWLVDPLDGTKEFVKKNGEFTVNIALIHKGKPVLGVVYAPALNACYWAKLSEGAFKDGKRMPLKSENIYDTYKIVVSRSHMSDDTKFFIDTISTSREKELKSIGSSLKICMVSEGEANIYPRLSPTMEWDIAAAHIIAIESGKSIFQYQKNIPLTYNKKNLLNPSFIVE
jgi:3'(2'), 5'-bisphosphate nucleotidase